MAKKKSGRPPKKSDYSLQIILANKEYLGFGHTVLEALKDIDKPIKVFSKGTIHISCDDGRKLTTTWMVPRMRRLFQPLAMPLMAKQLNYLMK